MNLSLIKKLIGLLSRSERKRLWLLMVMMIFMALLDALGIASILPLMAVLTDPSLINKNPSLFAIYSTFGFTDNKHFLIVLVLVVFSLLVISIAFRALTTYYQLRFTYHREYSLSRRLVERYLQQPYTWFLNRHSADLGKSILSEVGNVVSLGINSLLVLIAQAAVSAALLLMLLTVDTGIAIGVGLTLGLIYSLIIKLTGSFISRLGAEKLRANTMRYTIISEAFGASKEIKVAGLESVFSKRFAKTAYSYANISSIANLLNRMPRFLLEAVAFGGLLLLLIMIIIRGDKLSQVIPIVSLYVMAAYRLMPSIQQIYSSITQLRYVRPALNELHQDIVGLAANPTPYLDKENIFLKKSIQIKDVSYIYPNSSKHVLNHLNLTIHAQTCVGLVGSTGSGKSTTVDLILGLLSPKEGSILVDGELIQNSNRRSWQKSIGYVPQQIFLSDDTVASNIAFGVEPELVDMPAVERAARIANLHPFVTQELADGYYTNVGERGVRLSGGQRQRIGIARALYYNPSVLILDEATSALDNLTEKAVMDAVFNLAQSITIILIAHRLSTVRQCDCVYLFEDGKVKSSGTYSDLHASSKIFQRMAEHC